jgi:hypothetical protein
MQSLLCLIVMLIGMLCLLRKNGQKSFMFALIFIDLNRATPKNEYHMHTADFLVNVASEHRILSFLDSNVGYN